MRLLVITHTFPPSRHSNAKRPYYVVRGLLDAGWEVEVWTSQLGMEKGEKEFFEHSRLTLRRVPDPVLRINQRFRPGSRLSRCFTLAAAGLLWPDWCGPWSRKVFRMLQRKKQDYDRVLAFVFPSSVLLAGDFEGLVDGRWTFDFQESVTPQFRRSPRRSPIQKWGLKRLELLERRTLRQAGLVIFTADSNRQAYLQADLVPEPIAEHVPYFYDEEVFGGERKAPLEMFEIHYFGGFDLRGDRNPRTFLQALRSFVDRHPDARGVTKFVFRGTWLAEHDQLIEEMDLQDVTTILPAVSFDEYLEEVRRSPVLLLVVAAAHNLFMPSKIVDYFGARRPILAFVPEDSEMSRVLDAAGMSEFSCDEQDVEAGSLALGRLWELYLSGNLKVDDGKVGQWSSLVQIPRYRELLEAGRDESARRDDDR